MYYLQLKSLILFIVGGNAEEICDRDNQLIKSYRD